MAIRLLESSKNTIVAELSAPGVSPARIRLSSPAANVFRMQTADASGAFLDQGVCQFLASLPGSTAKTTTEAVQATEKRGVWKVTSSAGSGFLGMDADTGRISLCRADGTVLTTLLGLGKSGDVSWLEGSLESEERLYGTGERFNGTNQRGKRVRIWAVDRWCQTEGNSYVPIPFVLSSASWGMLVNRYESSELDLGSSDASRLRISLDHVPLDVYLFLDATPAAILGSLSLLTGRAPLPAEWSFGIHVCRHARLKEFGTREGVMAMVRAMEEHRLPWSSVILEGWNVYDSSRYAELEALVAEIHAMGKKALVYEPCGRLPDPFFGSGATDAEPLPRGQGARPEYFVHNADGTTSITESAAYNPEDAPNRPASSFLDLTSPEAVRWWTEEVWGRILGKIGIDGAKIDFCEQFPEWDALRFADGRSGQGMHHLYPVLYNAMMYRLYAKLRPEAGMCFSRGGSTGAHLYPFIWCGDQLREWHFLRAILSSMLSAGISGVPFLCHDLAAYLPTRDPAANPEERVFVRGTQMGCFTVNMQTHGTVTRPYDFPKPIVDIYRLYSQIHYALVPYLREQAALSCRTGLPLMRHLVLGWPEDRTAWDCEDEFLLGEDLLVAPVLDDAEERDVYLPAGRWESLFGAQVLQGPKTLPGYSVPFDKVAVFLRAGAESAAGRKAFLEARRLAKG